MAAPKGNKVIVYGLSTHDNITDEKATHNVTGLIVGRADMIDVTIESNGGVNRISMTMEKAEEIGFINFNAIKQFI